MIKRLFALAGLLFFTGVLFGQVGKGILEEKEQELIERPIPVLRPGEVALEREIDPEAYVLGPGDKISINLWGEMEAAYVLAITPEGRLLIPTVKDIYVGNLTLSQAKKKVKKKVLEKYRNVEVTASLIELRKFRVMIAGEVENPGVYVATPADRLSELIERAQGFTGWAYEREIEITHLDGKKDIIDFVKFRQYGDVAENPFLMNGDVVTVPAMNLSGKTVRVEGEFEEPGLHQIQEGEKLNDFLQRIKALSKLQDFDNIYLIKNSQVNKIDLNQQGDHIILEGGEIIKVPRLNASVYVQGMVSEPGRYAFAVNMRAKDFVGMAGMTEKSADISKVKVIHNDDHSIEKGGEVIIRRGDTIIVPPKTRVNFMEYMAIVSQIATLILAYVAATK